MCLCSYDCVYFCVEAMWVKGHEEVKPVLVGLKLIGILWCVWIHTCISAFLRIYSWKYNCSSYSSLSVRHYVKDIFIFQRKTQEHTNVGNSHFIFDVEKVTKPCEVCVWYSIYTLFTLYTVFTQFCQEGWLTQPITRVNPNPPQQKTFCPPHNQITAPHLL